MKSPFRCFSGIFLAAFALLFCACGPKSDLQQPKSYADDLISFRYPGNWRITSNDEHDFGRVIVIEGRANAVVSLSIFSSEWDADFREYCEKFIESLPENIPFGTITDGVFSDAKPARENEQAAVYRYAVQVGSMKLPHTIRIWKQVHGDTKLIGVCQVSDEDRTGIEEGFDFIRTSIAEARPE